MPPPVPRYLGPAEEPVFAIFHPAANPSGTAVLLCSPFGWEDLCSIRSRARWAAQIAGAGRPALRFDLTATGDSGGSPRDPRRLDSWTSSVTSAAAWLRETTGCGRITAIGIGLGGALALRAAQQGAPIDDLVLWAVPARGKSLVREMRAFARLNAVIDPDQGPGGGAGAGDPEPAVLADGALEVGGFLISSETLQALEAMDLCAAGLPPRAGRRSLLLERDGMPVDRRLHDYLASQGVELATAPGSGYTAMMAHPQEATPPLEEIATVGDWLDRAAPVPEPATAGGTPADGSVEIKHGGGRLLETPQVVEQPFGGLYGVLAEPCGAEATRCVILLNAGALRRTGPGRLWVDLSRRWAAAGTATLRIDLEALGDSDGSGDPYPTSKLYSGKFVSQVRAALDHLESLGYPPRFVLAGLCSGAFWSFHGALSDPRVKAVLMINPRALFWDEDLEYARSRRMVGRAFTASMWRRALRGEIPARKAASIVGSAIRSIPRLRAARRSERRRLAEVLSAFDQLSQNHRDVTLVFGENEPLHAELERAGLLDRLDRWPNLELEALHSRDHSLRPIAAQQELAAVLDRSLARLSGEG